MTGGERSGSGGGGGVGGGQRGRRQLHARGPHGHDRGLSVVAPFTPLLLPLLACITLIIILS